MPVACWMATRCQRSERGVPKQVARNLSGCSSVQLWLWWYAPAPPHLPQVWRAYVARFTLEHTCRFVKQFLNWALPRVRHPEHADRWSLIIAYPGRSR